MYMHIGVLAKHDLYLDPIKRGLKSKNLLSEVTFAREIEELDLKSERFDYIFFPHYSRIIPKDVYENFTCVGFHVGNLPQDRGGSPIQNKIIRGEYRTFVNSFLISSSIDGGPIFEVREVDLEIGDIVEILQDVADKVAQMIVSILLNKPKPIMQPDFPLRFARLNREDSLVDLGSLSLKKLYDRIRMVDGLDYPRAFSIIGDKTVEFSEARLIHGELTFRCEVKSAK